VIIAGMGGETIADIMSRAEWISDGKHSFVLQPMTKSAELISRIYKMGLNIENARLAEDAGEIYLTLLVKAVNEKTPNPTCMLIPDKLRENKDPLLAKYLDLNIDRIKSAVAGIKISKSIKCRERLNELESLLIELIEMRGEL